MGRKIFVAKLLGLSRRNKRLVALTMDVLVCIWSVWAAFYLRLEEWGGFQHNQWLAVIVAVPLAIAIFIRVGMYRAIFRHASGTALLNVLQACLIYGAIYSGIFSFIGIPGVPRTIGLIQPVLLFLTVSATRAAAHYLLSEDYRLAREANKNGDPVLIYGAGMSGRQLAAALARDSSMQLVGFLDDDDSLHGALLNGVMVYPPSRLAELVADYDITDVLLAVTSASRRRRREIVDRLRGVRIRIRVLPGWMDLAQGRVNISELRPLEIEDLLGRPAVCPDENLLQRNITNRVVVVTGAGGSIGSELCRQILAVGPSVLLLVDHSEFALYNIHRELEAKKRQLGATMEIMPFLASVLDETRMRELLEDWAPSTIYHAAAYKHVPLIEHNVLEGVRNNVLGTALIAELAIEHGTANFVLISTDKAVRPTNVMGASKRLAEMLLQAHAVRKPGTCFSMVRFGNVLGSSGSVVPLFREQIAAGGPVTLTDPRMTRYFMTIPEAAQLVIQAGAMATGGEVFVLDMGQPVRIYDLAVNMIELSGLSVRDQKNPDGDIEIQIVGLRPGEKLYEELLIGQDPSETPHKRICKAHEQFISWPELRPELDRMKAAIEQHDVIFVLAALRRLIPEFQHQNGQVPCIDETSLAIGPSLRKAATSSLARTVG